MSVGPGRPVFLTGMMGAGKSTIAPLLAAAWGVPWIDLDVRVARIFGASVAALFARGEAQFRRCEHLSLRLLLAEPGLRARTVVIATGGGVVLEPASRALMQAAGPGRVLVVGFSMGALLALRLAASPRVAAVGRPEYARDATGRLAFRVDLSDRD